MKPSRTKTSGSRNATSTSRARFQHDVMERSAETLVVVDFWAPWCAPCRALGPILERLADEYAGRFLLVKVNVDEVPEAAAQFQVQGIPSVFAVSQGKAVDFFSGAIPESAVRGWLDQALQVQGLDRAREQEEKDPAAAEATYRNLLTMDAKNAEAKIGLARVLLRQQRIEECRQIIAELQQRGFLEPEAEKIKTALAFGEKSGDDLEERRAAAQAHPDDLAPRLKLAESLIGAQQFEEALQICLSLVERDRMGMGEQARQLMIDIFRVLPEDSELTSTYRRKLSMALF